MGVKVQSDEKQKGRRGETKRGNEPGKAGRMTTRRDQKRLVQQFHAAVRNEEVPREFVSVRCRREGRDEGGGGNEERETHMLHVSDLWTVISVPFSPISSWKKRRKEKKDVPRKESANRKSNRRHYQERKQREKRTLPNP